MTYLFVIIILLALILFAIMAAWEKSRAAVGGIVFLGAVVVVIHPR